MANNKIAFGLCKQYNIELPKGATPHDAWEALKKRGIAYGDDGGRSGTLIPNAAKPPTPEKIHPISIKIDRFTPCLLDVATGNIVSTEVAKLEVLDLSGYNTKTGWGVNWRDMAKKYEVLGVYVAGEKEPQGLIALKYEVNATYIAFAQVAPQNNKRILNGGQSRFEGVGGHLFAIAAEHSLKNGGHGFMHGYAVNERVLKHYIDKFGAQHISTHLHEFHFIIDEEASAALRELYTYKRR